MKENHIDGENEEGLNTLIMRKEWEVRTND